VAVDRAEPRERERVAVHHGNERGIAWHVRQKMRDITTVAVALPLRQKLVVGRNLQQRRADSLSRREGLRRYDAREGDRAAVTAGNGR
jgi:hypothetical protein